MKKLAVALVLSTLASACQYEDEPLPPEPTRAPGATGERGAPPPRDPPPTGPLPEPAALEPTGLVSVHQVAVGANANGTVGAYFGSKSGPPASCTKTTEGPCTLVVCPSTASDAIENPPTAGAIAVKGLKPASVVALLPALDGTYQDANYAESLFAADDAISVHAEGGAIPSFDLAVKAPPKIALHSPAVISIMDRHKFDRTKPLPVSWSGIAAGTDPVIVVASLFSTSDGAAAIATCEANLPSGKLTVPVAVMAKMKTDGANGGGMFSVSASRRKTVKVGANDAIRLDVTSENSVALFDAVN